MRFSAVVYVWRYHRPPESEKNERVKQTAATFIMFPRYREPITYTNDVVLDFISELLNRRETTKSVWFRHYECPTTESEMSRNIVQWPRPHDNRITLEMGREILIGNLMRRRKEEKTEQSGSREKKKKDKKVTRKKKSGKVYYSIMSPKRRRFASELRPRRLWH